MKNSSVSPPDVGAASAYVLRFLLSHLDEAALDVAMRHIDYRRSPSSNRGKRITIFASDFFDPGVFGAPDSNPKSLVYLDGVPTLFGTSEFIRSPESIFIGADLIASAFYFLTRHEEIILRGSRDRHGRFCAQDSILKRWGILERPIVDEYRDILIKCLNEVGVVVPQRQKGFSHIYLTHDADEPFVWNRLKRVLGDTKRAALRGDVRAAIEPMANFAMLSTGDPNDTFEFIFDADNELTGRIGSGRVTPVHFVMAGGVCAEDGGYDPNSRHLRNLYKRMLKNDCVIGLHPSYNAGHDVIMLQGEIAALQAAVGHPVTASRNHYLRSQEPEHYEILSDVGITHDFTMGFADAIGFRLGTCLPVPWFDISSSNVTSLVLNPLNIMDVTLDGPEYMSLDEESAFAACKRIVQEVYNHGGDLCLLWHNTVFKAENSHQKFDHKHLYKRVLGFVAQLDLGGHYPASTLKDSEVKT